jgi:hypothetical protein
MVKMLGGLAVGTQVELRRRGIVILGEVVWPTSTRLSVRSFAAIFQSALLDARLRLKVSKKPAPDQGRYGRLLRIPVRDGQSVGDMLVAEGLARTRSGRREPCASRWR